MKESGQNWTAACPGNSARPAQAFIPAPLSGAGMRYGGAAWVHESDMAGGRFGDLGMRLRGLRDEQRVQDELEQGVFVHDGEDVLSPAPATAHKGAVSKRSGASGPYPWRRPV